MHTRNVISSPGNGSPFTTTSAVGEYMQGHGAPALGNASQVHCWTNCSLLFPGMTNGRGGVSLSPQLGKARGGKHRYLGISRPGSPIFQRPITAKSQQQGDPNVPKSWVLWDNSANYVVHFINPACIHSFCHFPKGKHTWKRGNID